MANMDEDVYDNVLQTLIDKVEDIEEALEHKMVDEDGGYIMGGLTTTAQVVPTIADYGYGYGGYGRGYGCGYGTVSDGYIGYQTSRDVVDNRFENAKLHCETDKAVASGFSFQNLNEANRNADTRELILNSKEDIKDTVTNGDKFIESAILYNERLAGQYFNQLQNNMTSAELRAERRADMVDNKICNIEKEQAVASAVACERDKFTQYKLDTIICNQTKAVTEAINQEYAKTRIFGCSIPTVGCQ